MVSRLALILVVACGSCMEMRETVERMVMVRTTGSDLQPAATGYIYKKKNDGKESVIEMGESEVMEQLAKLYEQPKAFAAPIPITKGHNKAKTEDENEAESKSEERVIPVKEKQEDHIDGIADDDYKKIFDEYTSHYGDNTAYDDYIRSLGNFDDGIYKGYKGDRKHDEDGYKGYQKKHKYGNGDAGDYHNEKYESYSFSGKGHKGGAKAYDKHNEQDSQSEENGDEDAHNNKGRPHGFRKVLDKDDEQRQKDHGNYDNGVKIGFHKFADGHKYYGADDRGYHKDGSHESGHQGHYAKSGHHDEGSGEKQADNSSEERNSSAEKHGDYGSKSGQAASQGYGFEIKH